MMNLKVPENIILKPNITVFGVGGAGGNAVNNMISSNLQGVTFVVANTDAQALEHSIAENKIQLGATTTRGLGAGAAREVGNAAAEESKDEILSRLEGVNMVFITAGMGGGTGTGAAPVVARLAKELGILTVGVVTKPFHFEGQHRMKTADAGLAELAQYVDTLIVIPNQNLFRIANERTTFTEAFRTADEVLKKGVQSITDLMIMPGLINLDFADISAVMSEMGKAMMGTGEASGDNRAVAAAEAAISNPLLDQSSMRGAKGVLINITGGDMTLFEVDAAANRIREEVGNGDANIIFGSTFDANLEGIIRVSVVATGIDSDQMQHAFAKPVSTVINEREAETFEEEIDLINNNEEALQPEPIVPEVEVDDFDEYKLSNSTSAMRSSLASEDPVSYSSKPKETRSLLSKVWDSIKGVDSGAPSQNTNAHSNSAHHQQPLSLNKQNELENIGSSDIYEVPAFLRRKK